jgi:CubicO group peptidase (beta-lactamase class C family)
LLASFVLGCLLAPRGATASPGGAAVDPLHGEIGELSPLAPRHELGAAEARDLDELRDRVAARMSSAQAGLSLALVEEGRVVWTAGFGYADRDRRIPATPHTLYRVGSLSKGVVALGVLGLVEQGKLRLDQSVRELLPGLEFENPWEDRRPITIEQLLEHTSGFDEMHFNEMYAPDGPPDLPLAEVLSLNPRSRKVRWRPATRHGYSQPGYTVVARVLERLTGQSFEDYLQARVFDPLGMGDATFRYDEGVGERLAKGYTTWQRTPVPHRRLHHRPGGGLYVSADDLGKLVEMLVMRGRVGERQLFRPDSIERMERGETLSYGGLAGDYGLGNYPHDVDGIRAQGHGGWMPGFDARLRYFPEQRAGFVMLRNLNGDWQDFQGVENELARYLLRDVERPQPPGGEVPRERLDALAGSYVIGNPNVGFLAPFEQLASITVARHGDRLLVRGPGFYEELVPTGDDTFRRLRDRRTTVAYTEVDGRPALVHGLTVFYRCSRTQAWLLGPGLLITRLLTFCALLSVLVWIPGLLVVGWRRIRGLRLWVYPCLSAYGFTGMVHVLFSTPPEHLGAVGPRTIAVFGLSWCFGLFAVVGLVAALRHRPRGWRGPSRALWLYSLFASMSLTGLAAHFARHGLIGVRTWMW